MIIAWTDPSKTVDSTVDFLELHLPISGVMCKACASCNGSRNSGKNSQREPLLRRPARISTAEITAASSHLRPTTNALANHFAEHG